MVYFPITFKTPQPVTVDWGNGSPIDYPSGIVTGTPSGEVTITSDFPIDKLDLLSDTVAIATFDNAPDLKYVDSMFKDKQKIQVVYFDPASPIETTRQTFENSGILYYSGLENTPLHYAQYMHKDATRIMCLSGLNTLGAKNAYDLFVGVDTLKAPRSTIIEQLEDTDAGGSQYVSTDQCLYPVYNSDIIIDSTNPIVVDKDTPTPALLYPLKGDIVPHPLDKYGTSPSGVAADASEEFSVFSSGKIYTNFVPNTCRGTFSGWYNVSDLTYTKLAMTYGGGTYDLQMTTDGTRHLQIEVDGHIQITSSEPLAEDTWNHVAFGYDEYGMFVSVNGVETTNTFSLVDATVSRDSLTLEGFVIGSVWGFTGKVTDVRWYNQRLSTSAVNIIYLGGNS